MQVVLKIIQHCEQEGGGPEAVQGNLLGLVDEVNKRVEITNCFPTPQRGDEEEQDSGQRKGTMRLWRKCNCCMFFCFFQFKNTRLR